MHDAQMKEQFPLNGIALFRASAKQKCMDQSGPGWDLYRTFLAVFRHGSLSVAARKIGLTQPTAGRHIAALEAQLGASLFTRSPRGLLPTEAAEELAPHAEAMATAAAALRRASSGGARAEQGAVRVTAG